jgi:predicted transposase/invertase (TIGR01784 family)
MSQLVRFDWAMKYLLRNKANFDILEGFLSELLKIPIHIEQVLESEGNKNTADNKTNRVDLLVKTAQNERIIIEVQCDSEWDYLSRILYGTAKTISEHLKQGLDYANVCKVISVSIVFFNLGEGQDYLYRGAKHFRGMHYHDELKLGESERKIYGQDKTPSDIFPEYYIIKVNQFRESIKDKFDEWVYFLKNEKIYP